MNGIREKYVLGDISYPQALVMLRQGGVEPTACMDIAAGWQDDRRAYEVCTDLTREDCTGCPYAGSVRCPEVY